MYCLGLHGSGFQLLNNRQVWFSFGSDFSWSSGPVKTSSCIFHRYVKSWIFPSLGAAEAEKHEHQIVDQIWNITQYIPALLNTHNNELNSIKTVIISNWLLHRRTHCHLIAPEPVLLSSAHILPKSSLVNEALETHRCQRGQQKRNKVPVCFGCLATMQKKQKNTPAFRCTLPQTRKQIAGCQLFFPVCSKNNYTFIQNWFGMVLGGEREMGAWRDCTLFGVITLSLEDLCVRPTATFCFQLKLKKIKMDLSPLCE